MKQAKPRPDEASHDSQDRRGDEQRHSNKAVSDSPWPCNQPSIAVNPAHPAAMAATGYEHRAEGRRIGLYRSMDGGETFAQAPLALPPGYDHAGAAMAAFGPGGLLLVAGEAYNHPARSGSVIAYRSQDSGSGFHDPVIVRQGEETTKFFDKPCVAIDHSDKSRFFGRAYISYTGFLKNLADTGIFIQSSEDQGATWSEPIRLSGREARVHGSCVAIGPRGEVYVGWIHTRPGRSRFQVRRSRDGGRTFAPTVTVATVRVVASPLPDSDWLFRVPTFACLATDTSTGPYRGAVYAVWQQNRFGSSDILLALSDDRGKTWSNPLKVNDSKSGIHDFFPAVTVSPENGTVHVIYYSNQLAPNRLDVFAAMSCNSGKSFGASQRVTDVSFNPNADPAFGKPSLFLGDYIGAAALPGNKVIAVWTDTRVGRQTIFSSIK